MEVSAFMTEQLKEQLAVQREHDERMRSEFKADKQQMQQQLAAMEMKMEQQQAEARAERERMEAKLAPREAATQAQLAALQARIESMHAAKLLSDDELCALEDLLADYFGLLACVEMVTMEMTSTSETADKVRKLVVLSEQMASDRPFARQCKRRFV
jgi:chromosome segregation ATPase